MWAIRDMQVKQINMAGKAKLKYDIPFFVAGAIYTFAAPSFQPLSYIKPLPLFILLVQVLLQNPLSSKLLFNTAMGVLLGLLGDVFLMIPGTICFLIGAICFLLGHLFYVMAFTVPIGELLHARSKRLNNPNALCAAVLLIIYLVALHSSTLSVQYEPHQQSFRYLIPMYLAVLGVLVVWTLILFYLALKSLIHRKTAQAMVGALLFFASDNILLESKFNQEFAIFGERNINGMLVMLTYYFAQWLIANSLLSIKDVELINVRLLEI